MKHLVMHAQVPCGVAELDLQVLKTVQYYLNSHYLERAKQRPLN